MPSRIVPGFVWIVLRAELGPVEDRMGSLEEGIGNVAGLLAPGIEVVSVALLLTGSIEALASMAWRAITRASPRTKREVGSTTRLGSFFCWNLHWRRTSFAPSLRRPGTILESLTQSRP
jgi:hypothetical protein